MRKALVFVGLFSLALGAAASAALAQGATDPACSWETAQPVSVQGLDGSEASLRGRCVRLRAELDGWSLSAPRRPRGLAETQTDLVGAYSEDRSMMDAFGDRPRRVEVLGVVGHCSDVCADVERQWEDARRNGRDTSEIPICMPTGFCHYYDDPYVMIEAVR